MFERGHPPVSGKHRPKPTFRRVREASKILALPIGS
jgi:hypothetical protein